MKYVPVHVIAAFSILSATPAFGADKTSPLTEPKSTAEKPAEKEKLVCEYRETAGTLMRTRVCRSQKQIDLERQATEDLNKERRALGGSMSGSQGMSPSGTLNGH